MSRVVSVLLFGVLGMSLLASASAPTGMQRVDTDIRPALVLPDLGDARFDLQRLRGKVVLVVFWASWCAPCIEEMPHLRALGQTLPAGAFQVVAVNMGDTYRRVRTLSRQLGLDFPVLLDQDGAVFRAWGGQVVPSAYVIDRDGQLRYTLVGPVDWQDEQIVAALRGLTR